MPPLLKLATDLGPLGVFFLIYQTHGLMEATGALIAATLVSLLVVRYYEKSWPFMPLVTAIAVTLFGGISIALNDDLFIKMKPTIVNILFASILIVGNLMGKPMLKYLLSTAISMTDKGWSTLSVRWGFFFLFLAALNEYIWRNYSTDFWVDFKVFGMFTLTILFTCLQYPLLKREMVDE